MFYFSQLVFVLKVPLMVLLEKFDGAHWTEFPVELTRKQYHLSKLPSYLVLLVTRFKKNRFFVEKNPTIVTFPVKNLDLAPYVIGATEVFFFKKKEKRKQKKKTKKKKKKKKKKKNVFHTDSSFQPIKYNLVSSIRHQGAPAGGK